MIISLSSDSVYRFIPIHRLWEIIAEEKLFFIRNSKWDDPFEGYLIKRWCEKRDELDSFETYKKRRYFLCCTLGKDAEFFWRTYTPNKDGVRLEISKSELLKVDPGIEFYPIKYGKKPNIQNLIDNLEEDSKLLREWYFYKRVAFKYEDEVRFSIKDPSRNSEIHPISINLGKVIKSITFDPRMAPNVFKLHKKFLEKQLPGLKIFHSNLYDPERTFRS